MRQLSDTEINRIKVLTEKSVELTLIEPTATGLDKSIMDATGSMRVFLKEKGVHDYELQKQGPENKVQVSAVLLEEQKEVLCLASLYRPVTKNGDPRIWFTNLKKYAQPTDILGIISFDKKLFVINLTRIDVKQQLESTSSNPLQILINEINQISNAVADELLFLLKKIARIGPVPALLNADTAVGRTLETLLGIEINSSKKPDYKGIELKAFRSKRGNRKNLFAQVPDWHLSKFKSSAEIVNNFGYARGVDFKLYCTVSTLIRNSQGLMLKMDGDLQQLLENSNKTNVGDFVAWSYSTLHKRLLEKHNETFWISAECFTIGGVEHFQYKKVEHTKSPIVSQFDILLQQGIITLDHLIKKTPNGRVVEKGPLFKIEPKSVGLLFPPSKQYDLI